MMGSVMLLLTASFNSSVRGKIEMSRDESNLMEAEFMVESALGFAMKQLQDDSSWPGTGNQWVELGELPRRHQPLNGANQGRLQGKMRQFPWFEAFPGALGYPE